MLVDEVKIKVSAGDGGNGTVAFNKNKNSFGPVGGRGGDGGSVYFEGVSDLNALAYFRHKKEVKGLSGRDGRGQFRDGAKADDIAIKVPVGTVIRNLSKQAPVEEIIKVGQKILVARGGQGGQGNFYFRSSTNTSPEEFEHGQKGEQYIFKLEMKMIANVGFIGLPNVGKSSLLNELTQAKSKVANYRFTTLEPNLGTYYDLILADIPGLIEGASKGKGLGDKFLRHIERTKVIFHLVAADSAHPLKDYRVIRHELGAYNKKLLDKPEYIFLSRSDVVEKDELKRKIDIFGKIGLKVEPLSIYDPESIDTLKKILNRLNE